MGWFRKESKQSAEVKPIKSEIAEDAPQTIATERMMSNWLDDVFTQYEKKGGLEDLPGKGKPLEVRGGDPLNGVLHNANVVPSWLALQHEIRDELQRIMKLRKDQPQADVSAAMFDVNQKIVKYNASVPSTLFQKSKVTLDTIEDQLAKWM
ncbi:DUF1992 domain-containing protein [Paenibacillus sp. chi10]|uniref:DUF1992 domain-containing protein n=1 Tax=Paenibacillus suaedae TaxID=3077233 RepID=A0AAJ2JVV0_9BACL|nr:DnaJ family domain-containing protein [Paenibacillus sp. chi10]MDT8976639.1 DUF1992 domain-containing protein [Paenibacillus sp. chi10]